VDACALNQPAVVALEVVVMRHECVNGLASALGAAAVIVVLGLLITSEQVLG